jgi:hypothetical protein
MATLFMNGPVDGFFSTAARYYRMCPEHRGAAGAPALSITRTIIVDPWNFQNLIGTIHEQMRAEQNKDVLIVSHGAFNDKDEVIGLKCPIRGTADLTVGQAWLEKFATGIDQRWTMDADVLEKVDDDLGVPPGMHRGQLTALMRNFGSLHRINLKRVDIVGCQIGKNTGWLKAFGRCLGCESISGPLADYGFATLHLPFNTQIGAMPSAKAFADFPQNHVQPRTFKDNTKDSNKTILIAFEPTHGHQANTPAASNTFDYTWFVDQFLMSGSRYPRGQATSLNYIPTIAFVRDGTMASFFLPLEHDYGERFTQIKIR